MLKNLVELVTVRPAKIFGIINTKGSLDIGKDADFVVIKPF